MDGILNLRQTIIKYINKETTANEIEFRIGTYGSSFAPGVTMAEFRAINKDYLKLYSIKPVISSVMNIIMPDARVRLIDTSEKINIIEYINSNNITKTMRYDIIKKHKIAVDDSMQNYSMRVAVNNEEKLDDTIIQKLGSNHNIKTFRLMERYSYKIYDGITLDLSVIKQGAGRTFKTTIPSFKEQKETYEVEFDVSDYVYNEETYETMIAILIDHITRLLLMLQGGIAFQTNEILSLELMGYKSKYDPRIFAQNIPINIEIISRVDKSDLVFVDKSDGERHMMYINNDGFFYLITGKEKIKFTNICDISLRNSLFDGELIHDEIKHNSEFHIFDVLYHNDVDMRDLQFYDISELSIYTENADNKLKIMDDVTIKTHEYYKKDKIIDEFMPDNKRTISYNSKKPINTVINTRYGNVLKLCNNIAYHTSNFAIKCKKFYPLNMLVKLNSYNIFNIDEKTQTISKQVFYELDGLIIQSKTGTYPKITRAGHNPQWNDSYKWKFPRNTTIDFLIVIKPLVNTDNTKTCLLRGGPVDIQQNFDIITGKIRTESGDAVSNGNIVECYQDETGIWKINRIRDDKVKANAINTIKSTLDIIKHPVTIDMLC